MSWQTKQSYNVKPLQGKDVWKLHYVTIHIFKSLAWFLLVYYLFKVKNIIIALKKMRQNWGKYKFVKHFIFNFIWNRFDTWGQSAKISYDIIVCV